MSRSARNSSAGRRSGRCRGSGPSGSQRSVRRRRLGSRSRCCYRPHSAGGSSVCRRTTRRTPWCPACRGGSCRLNRPSSSGTGGRTPRSGTDRWRCPRRRRCRRAVRGCSHGKCRRHRSVRSRKRCRSGRSGRGCYGGRRIRWSIGWCQRGNSRRCSARRRSSRLPRRHCRTRHSAGGLTQCSRTGSSTR